ncbi:MAG: copper resistance system multicopper oxidase [Lentisphaeria bacterium]
MKDDLSNSATKTWSRRKFLQATCLASTGVFLPSFHPLWAAAMPTESAGKFSELNATAPGGIDLYLERKDLLIGGRPGRTIAINGSIPGPVIRMQEGKEALIRVHNRMDESTSIHWHGILLPFNMDGVPGISYPGIPAGETFIYRYPVRQNGTYWYHSHTGLQEQLGHYGQLIVEPAEPDPVGYDVEHSIVLSDWTFENPLSMLRKLKTMEGYYNFQRPTLANIENQMKATGMSAAEVIEKRLAWDRMRMDPTDIADITGATYTYLMNGKAADENPTFIAKPGQRVRLRINNASTMTFYDVRIPGLPMTVVQADGQNIKPVETDEFRIGVAETYDVIVTLPDSRAYTLFAETMDRSGYARGTLAPRRGMSAEVPEQRRRPMLTMADMGMMMHGEMGNMNGEDREGMKHDMPQHASSGGHGTELPTTNLTQRLKHGPDEHGPASITMAQTAYRRLDYPGAGLGDDGWCVLTYSRLRALEEPYDRRPPTRQFDLHLTGNMHKYIWGFDGKKWSQSDMIRFQYGERLRINMINDTILLISASSFTSSGLIRFFLQ